MPLSKSRISRKAKKKKVGGGAVKRVRLAIECTPLERRHMKMVAASEDKTLNEFILESVRMRLKRCGRSHTPNAQTIKAMHDAERGEGLVEFKSTEDFLKSLEE